MNAGVVALDQARRRDRLATTANPAEHLDYLVARTVDLPDGAAVVVTYVPDRRILADGMLEHYLAACASALPPVAEACAALLVADLNNELVPRWLRVEVDHGAHRVVIEDRQPGWGNDELLSRLPVPARESPKG